VGTDRHHHRGKKRSKVDKFQFFDIQGFASTPVQALDGQDEIRRPLAPFIESPRLSMPKSSFMRSRWGEIAPPPSVDFATHGLGHGSNVRALQFITELRVEHVRTLTAGKTKLDRDFRRYMIRGGAACRWTTRQISPQQGPPEQCAKR